MFYLHKRKREYVLYTLQSDLYPKLELPLTLKPEEKCTLYMEENLFLFNINELYKANKVPKLGKWYPVICDSTGKNIEENQ